MLNKNKPVRLKGAALRKLHEEVYELDGGCDVLDNSICIPPGTPAHHVNFGAYKEDIKENMCMLWNGNHVRAHSGECKDIERQCKAYLRERDGENKWNKE